jgi:hypothetical protein
VFSAISMCNRLVAKHTAMPTPGPRHERGLDVAILVQSLCAILVDFHSECIVRLELLGCPSTIHNLLACTLPFRVLRRGQGASPGLVVLSKVILNGGPRIRASERMQLACEPKRFATLGVEPELVSVGGVHNHPK